MKSKQGKYLLIMGFVITVLALFVLRFDSAVGFFSLIIGLWTAFRGVRLITGHQPYLVKKQQEYHKLEEEELKKMREERKQLFGEASENEEE